MKQSTGFGEIECVALLRFPVTWSYLNQPPVESAPVAPALPAISSPKARTVNAFAAPSVADVPLVSPKTSTQWEMVIPKMSRPPAAPARLRTPEALAPEPAPVAPEPGGVHIDFAPSLLAKPAGSALARYWRWIAVAVVAVAAVGFTFLGRPDAGSSQASRGERESAVSSGWARSGVSAPGRVVSVYDPSRGQSDYRVEFGWVPDSIGVGWLFRIRDANNYYGARLSQLHPGNNSALVAEHFEVVKGVETTHTRRVIPLARTSPMVRVRVDVMGPAFTLWVEGSRADDRTDARLRSGPFGFYEERGQRPSLQTVRFTFFQKGAARVAATSYR